MVPSLPDHRPAVGKWAIDLGTTNTAVALWETDRPKLVDLPALCRKPEGSDPLEAPRVVPSATRPLAHLDFASRLGRRVFVSRHFFLGHQALIGRPAIEAERDRRSAAFVPGFKAYLEREPLRPLSHTEERTYTARDVARMFFRELFAEVDRVTGERIRDLVITAPIDAYESYRAELQRVGFHLGIRKLRFLDEPVAAALGYGLGLHDPRIVLVVDIGGGTMHLALVRVTPQGVERGVCRVVAKEGRGLGGNVVDRWVLREMCRRLDYPLVEDPEAEEEAFWFRALLGEACRLKESLFFRESDLFNLIDMRSVELRMQGKPTSVRVGRAELVEILRFNGFYEALEEGLDAVLRAAESDGIGASDIQDVLMVGGSTLLPDVYGVFERRFGRDRVRAWQPFEAVAYGAAAFASGAFGHSDFIVHDYAFVTHHPKTHDPEYTVVVPRGTRFPTPADLWKRQLVPTCALGEPETLFKLLICEIGRSAENERTFYRDGAGGLHKVGGHDGGETKLVVPLNESNPTLGYLTPPHAPGDRRPRLEISFSVNEDRWLCANVLDLLTRKNLMNGTPVVRLL